MRRLFLFLALGTATLGVMLTFPDFGSTSTGLSAHTASFSTTSWAIGLVMGFALSWLVGIDWSSVPERLGLWLRLQRRRLGWAVFGGLFAAILLLM